MTVTLSVDPSSIRHDAGRGGVDFAFVEGATRHRAHVPDEAIADFLKVRTVAPAQATGFVGTRALRIALHLVQRLAGRRAEGDLMVSAEDLRLTR